MVKCVRKNIKTYIVRKIVLVDVAPTGPYHARRNIAKQRSLDHYKSKKRPLNGQIFKYENFDLLTMGDYRGQKPPFRP